MDFINNTSGPGDFGPAPQEHTVPDGTYVPPEGYHTRAQRMDPWNQSPPPKRRRWTWLVIIAIVAVIAAFASYSVSMMTNIWRALPDSARSTPFEARASDRPRLFSGVDSIERAPNGTGVVMTLQPEGTDSMAFQDIYKQVIHSVVSVSGIGEVVNTSGTGIVMTEDGYIITNYHIISGCSAVEITLEDESSYPAFLVGSDEQSDLAVLKIKTTGLVPATFGRSDLLEVGDQVLAIGNPMGIELRGTMTNGIISAINRDILIDGKRMTLLQTNAALNAGNSGGPLINLYGQVIGINIAKLSASFSDVSATSIEGLGFSIPISTAKGIIDELIQSGYISGRTTLGITAYGISEEEAAFYRTTAGLYVESVDNRSDAYAQDLRPGDIIVKVNGTAITSPEDLENAKTDLNVGDTLSLQVYRNGSFLTIDVLLMDKNTFST